MSERVRTRLDMDWAGQLLQDAYRVARLAGYPAGGWEMVALTHAEERYATAAAAYEATLPGHRRHAGVPRQQTAAQR